VSRQTNSPLWPLGQINELIIKNALPAQSNIKRKRAPMNSKDNKINTVGVIKQGLFNSRPGHDHCENICRTDKVSLLDLFKSSSRCYADCSPRKNGTCISVKWRFAYNYSHKGLDSPGWTDVHYSALQLLLSSSWKCSQDYRSVAHIKTCVSARLTQ
jgi:hypothetical protein